MKCDLSKKHSRKCPNFFGISGPAVCLLLLFLFPAQLYAQMFSVGEQRTQFDIPGTAFYLGLEPISVSYYGNDTSAEAGGFEFDGPLIRLRYESFGINLFLATGGAITGIDEQSYFDIGGNIDFGLPVYRSEKVSVEIPLELKSIYTTMTNSRFVGSTASFRFGSLMGGAGARFRFRPDNDIRFELSGMPGYGLTFASGGFFGGSLGMLAGSSRIYFDRLFGDMGISVGYDYNYRDYNVDEPLFDYRMKAHSVLVGITF